MWRVLVADDEPVILSGIKRFIEECDYNCEVIAEANDGIEAIEMIEKYKPDIVVSDIQMPGATGLEIIKKFYDNINCPKFIFISGYDEFKYVQEALRYEAVDYLLKPVTVNQINEIIKKITEKLSSKTTISALKEIDTESDDFFKVIDYENCFEEDSIYKKFKEVKIYINNCLFIGIYFNINFENNNGIEMQYERREFKKFIIYDYINNYYKNKNVGIIVKKDDLGCQVILVIPKANRDDYIDKYILQLKRDVETEHNVELHVGIGSVIEDIGNIKYTIDEAKIASELYYFEQKDIIAYDMFKCKINNKFESYENEVELVMDNLISRYGQVQKQIEIIFDKIEKIYYGNKNKVVNKSSLLIENIYMRMKNYNLGFEEIEVLKNKVLSEINNSNTFLELKKVTICYFNNIKEFILLNENIREKVEIARVKKYIQENYYKKITLKMLADMIGMNATYFSVFFKKNAGENYIAYITKVRMKEAHRLLISTDLLTYEIAEKVGYNTVRRFTDTFRKTYGLNPTEYKKKLLLK